MPGLQSLSYAPGQNPKQNKKQTRNKQKETDNVKKQRRKKQICLKLLTNIRATWELFMGKFSVYFHKCETSTNKYI